ncbi:Fe-S cluster assembly sulfur transfer protein SufU [Lachnospira multipara]|uniref:FeS assembly scaffold apoprotein IscU n=1 Tax=Lachnospira multipara TaxID=28051 RepID=A0A1H5UF96_9FIRM|nr:SUF system NifU family Fe-S cluster assembly protein [Lachnospira multipara]SEF73743.1 FeS assembly scaffold apoprotein IscU [Lachnospira multipara]
MENNRSFYNEILTEHNINPFHKHEIEGANLELRGVNPSCGDEITLKLKVENDKIVDAGYIGDGCAISQASADMMIDLVLGKTKEEALNYANNFLKMIKGEASLEEIESLEEAGALQDISHMPARVKCAVLSWHTLEELFDVE